MLRPFAFSLLSVFVFSTLSHSAPEDVIAEMEKIQSESATRTASLGLCFVPIDGEPSDAKGYHIDTGLIPASTMKAITTATANEVLGGDFRFTTELQTAGVLSEEGVLKGNLVIRGGGDPTLGSSNIAATFSKWQTAMKEAGIQSIEGSIVGDATIFHNQMVPNSWQWDDMGNYYAAGPCGLTFHQNLFHCNFKTPKVGGKAPLSWTDPKLPGVEFINEMRVGSSSSGDQGYVYGAPYGKVYYLRGSVPAGKGSFTIKGALPDPAFFCARAFSKYLNENDLSVSGDPTTVRLMTIAGESLAARKVIHSQESGTLASIMNITNMKSNNLRAECIHRMIGVKKGDEGSIKAAAKAVRDHWSAKGVDMTGFFMDDGCGLARANTVTPRQMAMILYHAAKGDSFDTFHGTLPVAGRSGTLRSIGGGSSSEGRVVAKSGTIDRVRNYAGYVNTRSGKRYAFALFVNNYSGDLGTVKSQIVRIWNRLVAL
ncbi:MAG: D-alanyl-D-alanine carboxypeptidase/D-alanyl-D-alanine-endopeptidase [Verrucomicrobiales bacterium]|nr:D-alanyl-D-alanine carboxypeptidase/D-alanyl-D-alanine-endopeptidase [Verrucomicrobiales bacterium]